MTTVTMDIGTSWYSEGRDYSSISAWEADLDDSTFYSDGDDAVGDCYDDGDFAEIVGIDHGDDIDGIGDSLNSITLKAATGEGHDGTSCESVGVKITGDILNPTGLSILRTHTVLLGGIIIYDILLHSTHAAGKGLILGDSANATNTDLRRLIHKSEGGSYNYFIYSLGGTTRVSNSVGYGGSDYGLRGAFTSSPASSDSFIYNNTFDSAGTNGIVTYDPDYGDYNIRNNICTRSGTADFDVDSGHTEDYNLASDTSLSGANSLESKTAADQFVSITSGAENFLLKDGADAIDAGVDLGSGNEFEIDIVGYDRHAGGIVWDMGSNEFIPPPSVTFTPAVASCVASAIAPSVEQASLSIVPAAASCVASAIAPSVLGGSLSLTPTLAACVAGAVSPSVTIATVAAPAVASCVASAIAPSVEQASLSIVSAAASCVASAIAPSVEQASLSIVPAVASAVASASLDGAIVGTSVAPAAAVAVAGASVAFVGTGMAQGLEYDLPLNRLHYNFVRREEYTLPLNRLHFEMVAAADYTHRVNRCHFELVKD